MTSRRTRTTTTRCSLLVRRNIDSLFRVTDRVSHARFSKTLQPQLTGITMATSETLWGGIIAAVRECKINPEFRRLVNDGGFAHRDQRSVHAKLRPFRPGLGCKCGQLFKRGDEFGPTIGRAAVVDCVYADENVAHVEHLRPGERVAEKNRIARRNVGEGNPV